MFVLQAFSNAPRVTLVGCTAAMTIAAPHVAQVDLFYQSFDARPAANKRANRRALRLWLPVIELEHHLIALATVDAGVLVQIMLDDVLGDFARISAFSIYVPTNHRRDLRPT